MFFFSNKIKKENNGTLQDNFEEDAPFFLNISSQQMSDLKESNSREFIVGACLQALAFRLAAQTKLKKDE